MSLPLDGGCASSMSVLDLQLHELTEKATSVLIAARHSLEPSTTLWQTVEVNIALKQIHQLRKKLRPHFIWRLNAANKFHLLPDEVLHRVVHLVDSNDLNPLRRTSHRLLGAVDAAEFCRWHLIRPPPHHRALFQRREQFLKAPWCRDIRTTILRQFSERESDAMKQRLGWMQTLSIHIGRSRPVVDERLAAARWASICDVLREPAPFLTHLKISNRDFDSSLPVELYLPSDLLGEAAPSLRSVALARVRWRISSPPAVLTNLVSLSYRPPSRRMVRDDLAEVLLSLPSLQTLYLNLLYVEPYRNSWFTGPLEAPIAHFLKYIRVEGWRYTARPIFHLLHDHSTTLQLFEGVRVGAGWHSITEEFEQNHELVMGLRLFEVVRPGSSGGGGGGGRSPPVIRRWRKDGPDYGARSNHLLHSATRAQFLTKVTIHEGLWASEPAFAEASALTVLHVLLARCHDYRQFTYWTEHSNLFFPNKDLAWRVPALRHVQMSYTSPTGEEETCGARHACCMRGTMIVSAEIISSFIATMLVFDTATLDSVRLTGVETIEREDIANGHLSSIAEEVVISQCSANEPAARSVFTEFEDTVKAVLSA
ncbi:hypothetical protein BKA62DRAFT_120016 [Auriculariales sp. MPI-PUGE-AT-0066]|nr:hypothetical protein BKA62DRAFT_120016 [Auriculariales sp. MPI-PUGE-AT-0066]